VPAAANLRTVNTYPAEGQSLGTTYTPTFTWDKVTDATWYELYVGSPNGAILDQWYQASVICTTTCSVPLPTTLGGGSFFWNVLTYNSTGYGPWGVRTNFTTAIPTVPAGAVLTAPIGTISSHTPTFTWDKVPMTKSYRLYVKGPSGLVLDQWYLDASICSVTTCTVVSPSLESGDHIWWVQAYNAIGYGQWKKATFTVSP
jgi:hypothetical protein